MDGTEAESAIFGIVDAVAENALLFAQVEDFGVVFEIRDYEEAAGQIGGNEVAFFPMNEAAGG